MICRLTTAMAVIALIGGCDVLRERYLNRPEPDFETLKAPEPRLVRPVSVVVDTEAVLVGMDDGVVCVGPSRGRAALGGGWTGQLTDCPHSYTYRVELSAGAPSGQVPLFEVLDPPLPADEDEVPFRPIAVVVVTDPIGRAYRFETQDGF